MLRRRILQLALAAVAVGIPLVACREPTQITLVITTDVPCPTVTNKGVDVRVGSPQTVEDQPTTDVVTKSCHDTSIGSIVVVPSGDDDGRVGIEVTLGTGGVASADCRVSSSSGCIIARRTLGYVPHTSLVLPIHLAAKCVDVACAVGQTCVEGVCRGSEVSCPGGTCGPETLPPVDAGIVDAAPDVAIDATVDAGADSGDAGHCAQICTGGVCVGDVCQLATGVQPDVNDTGGCIAADAVGKRVWWTSNRGSVSALDYVPRSGAKLAVQAVAAVPPGFAAGVAALTGTVNAGIYDAAGATIYEFDSLLTKGTRATQGSEKINYVARAPNADVCWTSTPSGNLVCTGWGAPKSVAGGGVIVGASLNYVGVTTSTAYAYFFKRGNSTIYSTLVPQNVWGLAADPSRDVFFTFGGPAAPTVLMVDVGATVTTQLIDRTGSTQEASVMAYDTSTQSIFWTERQPNATFNIYAAKATQNAPVHLVTSGIPHQNCIAVDDEAVYWLNGGTPYKTAK